MDLVTQLSHARIVTQWIRTKQRLGTNLGLVLSSLSILLWCCVICGAAAEFAIQTKALIYQIAAAGCFELNLL